MALVEGQPVVSAITGCLRGILPQGTQVPGAGFKAGGCGCPLCEGKLLYNLRQGFGHRRRGTGGGLPLEVEPWGLNCIGRSSSFCWLARTPG